MGGTTPRRRIHDAFEQDNYITDVHMPTDLTRRSYDILYEVCEEQDVPVDPNKIGVAEVSVKTNPWGGTWFGGAIAFGCGAYQYGVDNKEKWSVEKTPKGYIIAINQKQMRMNPHKHETTLRHELAHIVNFETEGYTVEQHGIHSEWMDKLDAWEPWQLERRY